MNRYKRKYFEEDFEFQELSKHPIASIYSLYHRWEKNSKLSPLSQEVKNKFKNEVNSFRDSYEKIIHSHLDNKHISNEDKRKISNQYTFKAISILNAIRNFKKSLRDKK